MSRSSSRRRPRIVITTSVASRQSDPALAVHKNELYAAAIRRQGGEPILVDAAAGPGKRREALASMDGLVLSGGADVHPARYGETIRGTHAPEEDRDGLEAEAWEMALAAELPVLGVCRGLQAINVFLGGRLIQHVDGHAGAPYGRGPALVHPFILIPGTRLAAILGPATDVAEVNSYHHQAVRSADLAPDLVPAAWAPSPLGDLVEALELPTARFVIAVQCHPERTESTPAAFELLWRRFVEAASGVDGATRRAGTPRT